MLRFLTDTDPMSPYVTRRNLARLYDFMQAAFVLWEYQNKPRASLRLLQEMNYYAAHFLSPHPGAIRSTTQTNVDITNTPHQPPPWQDVDDHLAGFMVELRDEYDSKDPLEIASFTLWKINWIHPFTQGNGRSARAFCYFLICQKYEKWLPGKILPELIRENRDEYCEILQRMDLIYITTGSANLDEMIVFLERLLDEQLSGVDDST